MSRVRQDIKILVGADQSIELEFLDGDCNPIDMSAATVFLVIRENVLRQDERARFPGVGSSGKVTVAITRAQSLELGGADDVYDLVVTEGVSTTYPRWGACSYTAPLPAP